ncbi:glycerol dehydrogenase [Izhakiella australiensis]|uniref:Glycerol dehydrogenase n=1 Tax=Izhakiella australiensis TaxID=1926881 RepID=A0A1S8YHZ3_9GAMM|nr:glycerol dehydrogenase [Izhakiella australiensis]OON38684.1 glycerol dehydrogenase [Izhakiella australiensis]
MSAGNLTPIKGARFPGRYLQGAGALARLGEEIAVFGQRALLIVDRGVWDNWQQPLRAACKNLAAVQLERHGGDCTEQEINRLRQAAVDYQADVVVGLGGGKALDTAKAVAWHQRCASIIVPTIAASDAPCSALAVIYNPDGSVAYDLFLPRNPDLVLVDSALIAQAPARFLVAGMGDALATFCEAEACRLSNSNNSFGVRGLPVAWAVARQCLDTLFACGAQALAECREQRPGDALERIIEANILLSGIGFESGGVAAAHAIHHGLCQLHETHDFLHGEKVALGTLAELKLQQAPEAFFQQVKQFCQSVGLPVSLAQLGIADATPEKLALIAERACRPGEIIYNEAVAITPQKVIAALEQLRN